MSTDLNRVILSIIKVDDIVNNKMYEKTHNMFQVSAQPRNFKMYLYSQTGKFLMEAKNRKVVHNVKDLINDGPILETDLDKYITIFPMTSVYASRAYAFMIDIDLKSVDLIEYETVRIKDFTRINDVIKSIVGQSNVYILESGIRKVQYESKKDPTLNKEFYKFGYHIFVECGKYNRYNQVLKNLYNNLKNKIDPIIKETNIEYGVDMSMTKNLSFVNGSSKINSEFKFIKVIRNKPGLPDDIINVNELSGDALNKLNIECFEVSTLQIDVNGLPESNFKLETIQVDPTLQTHTEHASENTTTNLIETYDMLMQDLSTNSKKIDIVQDSVDSVKDSVSEFRDELNDIKNTVNQLKDFIASLGDLVKPVHVPAPDPTPTPVSVPLTKFKVGDKVKFNFEINGKNNTLTGSIIKIEHNMCNIKSLNSEDEYYVPLNILSKF